MANITTDLLTNLSPELAIIVYSTQEGYSKEFYLESRQILDGKMGAGKPLTQEAIQGIVDTFYNTHKLQSQIFGITPENLLACEYSPSNKILIWYREPEVRPMFFTPSLHIPNGDAWQPGLIYLVHNHSLNVYAFAGSGRPVEAMQLFRAPYHNINSSGNVCLGSSKAKKPSKITYSGQIAYYELLFWGSEFSHLAGGDSPINGNINTYWKNAIMDKRKFRQDILSPINELTFGKLIKQFLK